MPPNTNTTENSTKITSDAPNKQTYGLTTSVALGRLHDDIERILLQYEHKFKGESWYRKIIATFVEPDESPLGWFATATTLLTAVALVIAHSYTAAACLVAILLLNLFLVIREHKLRRTEIYRKTRHALAELRLAEKQLCADWQPNNYPHTCCPMSPCVSLQWTYRDGVIVNLPWALLVQGDHIVLRPGHLTPGPCTEVGGRKSFNANEIYGVSQISDPPVRPVARAPLPDLVCCLKNTPFLDNLRMILENALQRPPTIYNQQRYLLVTKYIQQWGFILALALTIIIGMLRMHGVVISSVANEHANHENWRHIMLEAATAVLPLLPLIFPIIWISMDLWGMARLKCFLNTPQTILGKDTDKSYEADLDTPTYNYDNISLMRSNVFRNWLQLWQGDSELLPRTSNVVQVLGSITALCCVDKKGILSWPNPTAEKVFFLHDKEDDHLDNCSSSQSSLNTDSDEPVAGNIKSMGIVAEVLDLTHDQHCPFRLEFDDTEWKNHIKSLKPLGLAILLNTCSPSTHSHYTQFCGHVTAVAMLDKDLVPVTNRYAITETSLNSLLHGRCLCELAKQIGFTDHATDRFTVEGQLAIYRHLQPDVVRRDIRFARQFQLTSKVKVPFPHSLSVVMRENPGGYLSLFTQGTADIILDCCDDFWDGKDLHPLSQQDRKRALDFYQRSALTAYCTAFAYRPLRHGIHGALSGGAQAPQGPIAYLELPPESKIRMQHVDKMHCDFEVSQAKLSHSISTDSLLYSEINKEEDISNVDGCYEMQCHQVFIGMVTMQYQAQTDIVELVEQLERACIRFVHFSKENELRSRVFSEKMGLESGWNCHISLLSEVEEKAMMNTGACGGTTQSPKSSGKHDFHSHQNITNNINKMTTTTSTTTTTTNTATTTMTTTMTTAKPNAASINNINDIVATSYQAYNNNNSNNNQNTTTTTSTFTNITTTSTSATTTNNDNNNYNRSLPPHNEAKIISMSSTKSTTNNTTTTITTNTGGCEDEDSDLNCLLPPANLESCKTLSCSAPGAISNQNYNILPQRSESEQGSIREQISTNASPLGSQIIMTSPHQQHASHDSAMEDEGHCRSMSNLTESSEQSAPVHFDMSNRAKLPRGIENIRPHLEQVDNVPLQVSLFTDCSAEATRQMLDIMQSYGEIVVCLGSSASNANAKIFLQADCSIAVEPLYPQVCQDIPAYTEANILNNKLRWSQQQLKNSATSCGDANVTEDLLENGLYGGVMSRAMLPPANTVSPIYLSRLLNSLPCSISVHREDPLSLVAIIELSRRFSTGLWNCIQYWACCASTLCAITLLCTCLSLPPLLTPLMVLYLMSLPVPLIALSLTHIEVDPKTMNRATGKKQTEYDTRVFGFVLWCYGCKFLTPVIIMILFYCAFMAHPIEIFDVDEDSLHVNLHIGRHFAFLGIILHFVIISASFVHRDHSLWQRNPLSNYIWVCTCGCLLLLHSIICCFQVLHENEVRAALDELWPAILFLFLGSFLSLIVTEITKWQEIKVNTRYQRRARLDFGTKLGMNSPF